MGSSASKRRTELDEGGCPSTTPILFFLNIIHDRDLPCNHPERSKLDGDGGDSGDGGNGSDGGDGSEGCRHPQRQTPSHTTVGSTRLKPILPYYYYARTSNAPASLTSWGYERHTTRLHGDITLKHILFNKIVRSRTSSTRDAFR